MLSHFIHVKVKKLRMWQEPLILGSQAGTAGLIKVLIRVPWFIRPKVK